MALVTLDKKITQEQSVDVMRPLELDLEAVFNVLKDEAFALLDEGLEKGKDPEDIITEIGNLLQ